jgi:glutamine synthetase
LILAAGLKGIDESYDLPREAATNLFELTEVKRSELGIQALPSSLDVALDEMERSTLVREALGEHIFEWFLRNKRSEWNEYQRQVTPFELKRYLPIW